MPAPVNGPVTQGFGPTEEPLDGPYGGYAHFNKGYDFGVPVGTPVQAVVPGTVIWVGDQQDGWGLSVKVRDAQGYTHNYGHLSGFNVKQGDTIRAGQVVGASGNTGASTGPHLSYDVWDSSGRFIDPTPFLSSEGGGGGSGGDLDYSGAAGQLQDILSEMLRDQPKREDFTDEMFGPGGGAIAYQQAFSEWAQSVVQVQQTISRMTEVAGGFTTLPDGTVMALGDLTPEQRQQVETSNQNAYRAILNDFGLTEYDLLSGATADANQTLTQGFQNEIARLNASLALDQGNLSRAVQELNRWVSGQDVATSDARNVLDAQKMAMQYGTTGGKSSFSGTDLGGAVAALAAQGGLNPDAPLIRYPGTQQVDPVQQRLDSLAGMGISNTPPLIPAPITTPGMIPMPPTLQAPPPPPMLAPPMLPPGLIPIGVAGGGAPVLPPPPTPSYSSPAETISSRGGGFVE